MISKRPANGPKHAEKRIVKSSTKKKSRVEVAKFLDVEATDDGPGHDADDGYSDNEKPTAEDESFINDGDEGDDDDENSDEPASEDAEQNPSEGAEDESSQDVGEEVADDDDADDNGNAESEEKEQQQQHGSSSEDSEDGSSTGSERARKEERKLIASAANAKVSKTKKPKKSREEWKAGLDEDGLAMWEIMETAYAPDNIETFFEGVLTLAEQAVENEETKFLPRSEGTQGHNWINKFTQIELRNVLTEAGYDFTQEGKRGIPNAFTHTGTVWTDIGSTREDLKARALELHERGKQIMRDQGKLIKPDKDKKKKKNKRLAENDAERKALAKFGKTRARFSDTLSQDDVVYSLDLGKHLLSVLTPSMRKWIAAAMRKKHGDLSKVFDMANFGTRSSVVANELERQRAVAMDFIEFHELMQSDDKHGLLEFEKADEFRVEFHHPPEEETKKQIKVLRCPPFFARATLSFEPDDSDGCTPYFLFDNIGLKVKTSGTAIGFMSSCGISVTLDRPFTGWFYFASQLGHELLCLGQFGLGN